MKKLVYWRTVQQSILVCCCIILLVAAIHPVSAAPGAPDEVWNNTYGGPLNDYGYGVNVASWAPITIVGSAGRYAYRETVDSLGTQWSNGTYGANSTYYGVTDVPWELGFADAAFVMVGKRASNQGVSEGKIAFYSNRSGNPEIFVMNVDGTNPTNLTNNPAWDYGPAWSPDGTKIAFVSWRDGLSEIYVMNTDGTNPIRLTNDPVYGSVYDESPTWSPDGTKIAFDSTRDGNYEIYVMNADGTSPTRLTINTALDFGSAWSPDGTKIAFVSWRDGNPEIYVMNANGTNPTNLTNNPAWDNFPTWSPDGTKIAFVSLRDGNFEIYVMNADGTNPTRLTNNQVNDSDPAWSPNGTKIAFDSERDGNYEIYVMNANGTGQTRITTNTDDDLDPAWSTEQKPSEAIVRKVPWKTYPQNSFSVTYGPPVYYDAALKAVHNTYNPLQQDLFYVAGGHTSSAYDAPSDAWLVEIGVGGGINWSRSYGGSNDDWLNEYVQTSDGSFTLAGGTRSYGTGIPASPNLYLIRTDPNGNFVWDKTYGGTNKEVGNDIVVTPDGGYLIVGDTYASGEQSDIWLIKTDSNGNMVWNKTYGGSGNDHGNAIHNTTDGSGYIIVGSTSSYGNGTSDIWMMRVDTSGNEIWNRTFGGTGIDEGYDVDGFLDGYVISGSTTSLGAGGSDLWLIRTGPEKNIPDTSITVVQPPPSYFYRQGGQVPIEWQYTGNPGSAVKIELIKGSVVDSTINASTSIGTGGQGNYTWTIPINQPAGTDYKVRITSTANPVYNDTSDGFFEIAEWVGVHVTSPNGGESWAAGSTHLITWEHKNTGAPIVQIELFKGGVRDHIMNTSAPIGNSGVGSYSWTIPPTQSPGSDYSIRVWSNPNGYTGNSDGPFTISAGSTKIGVYKDGVWYLDSNGDGAFNTGDSVYSFGLATWSSVLGDWNGDNKTKVGVYKDGVWYLDTNGDGVFNTGDSVYSFGLATWSPVLGNWNGLGKTEIGVYKDGVWYLDTNGDGAFNAGDSVYSFGLATWSPVLGDWNGLGKTEIGVYKDGVWYLDTNGDGTFNAGDSVYSFGLPGWSSVIGDWDADGKTEIGVYKDGVWYLDTNGDGVFNAGDSVYSFGLPGWLPVLGDWNGDVKTEIGVYKDGVWYLDSSGDGVYGPGDRANSFGLPYWIPVVGKWN